MSRLVLAVAIALSLTTAALAQNDVCIDPGSGVVDQRGTDTFRQMMQRTTPDLVQAMAGTWYAEIASPGTNQVDYHYNVFEPNGLFQYQSRVCGGLTGLCNDYQGHGFWAAMAMQDGTITTMLIVSDLNRNNQCAGGISRFVDQMTMQDSTGTTWRRVQ